MDKNAVVDRSITLEPFGALARPRAGQPQHATLRTSYSYWRYPISIRYAESVDKVTCRASRYDALAGSMGLTFYPPRVVDERSGRSRYRSKSHALTLHGTLDGFRALRDLLDASIEEVEAAATVAALDPKPRDPPLIR